MCVSTGQFTGFSVAGALFESLESVQDLGGSGFVERLLCISRFVWGLSGDCDLTQGDFGVLGRYPWKKVSGVSLRGLLEEAVGGVFLGGGE